MPIIFGGNRVTRVSEELAGAFVAGDHLVVVQTTGALLHIPAADWATAATAVDRAADAFAGMGTVSDEQISAFFEAFAARLADDDAFAAIAAANAADVEAARGRGRSVTRLVLSDQMRTDMIAGLRTWRDAPSGRGAVAETVDHDGWRVDQVRAGLGVVGFVFEGRPNVFADACGVMRSGNTVTFRIGSDALGTARAIVEHALDPALAEAGLPAGAASLVDSPARAAGWALFSQDRLALAVARQAGLPVSLHGTGGAWIVAGDAADPARFGAVVEHSLDRKVCNTLNTCCIPVDRADELVPVLLDALDRAGARLGTTAKLHVVAGQDHRVPDAWFDEVAIARAEGDVREPRTSTLSVEDLGEEWEWERSPEVTLCIVGSVAEAVALFNRYSPRFVASIISTDEAERDRFFDTVDAPFVGDGFTRWVDGQYALDRPELGLSNWQFGRLFGRGGVLSGDSVFTVRSRVHQDRDDLHR